MIQIGARSASKGDVPVDSQRIGEVSPMFDLRYSLVVEPTNEPDCFGFDSRESEGFTDVGPLVEAYPYPARWGMRERTALSNAHVLRISLTNSHPTITIQYEQPAVA